MLCSRRKKCDSAGRVRGFPLGNNLRLDEEAESRAKINLPRTIIVSSVHIQRLAKLGLARREACHKVQRWQTAGCASRLNEVAGRFHLSDVLVVEEIKALGHQLQYTSMPQRESPAQAHIGFPRGWIAVSIPSHSIDAVISAIAIHAGAEADDCSAGSEKLFRDRTAHAHGIWQSAVVMSGCCKRPSIRQPAASSAQLPSSLPQSNP